METQNLHCTIRYIISSYRTYEEWKQSLFTSLITSILWFLPYLWGMETRAHTLFHVCLLCVLTVPMRNGNPFFVNPSWSRYLVLTVPMRNGNVPKRRSHNPPTRFLPYLWGMETLYFYCRIRNEYQFLPYLWGMETTSLNTFHLQDFPFLPYLWGMETRCW